MKLRAYILSLLFTQAVCVSVFAQGLIIPSGGYVGLNNGYLVLGKNFENNGKFVQKAGTVIFAGGTQTIGGQTQTEFDNVSIATGSNTTIATGPQFLKVFCFAMEHLTQITSLHCCQRNSKLP